MELKVRMVGDVAIMDLCGKILMGQGDVLLQEQTRKLLSERHRNILLNMQHVSYMDSGGFSGLVACYKLSQAEGAQIKLLNPSPRVQDLLNLTRVDRLFDTHSNEQEALASF